MPSDPLSVPFGYVLCVSTDALSEFLESEPELASLFSEGQTEDDEVDEEDEDEEEEEDEEVEMERYETEDCLDPRASMFSTTSSLSTASKDSMLSTSSDFSPVSTLSSSSQASGTDSDFCEDIEEDPHVLMPIGKSKNSTILSKRLSRLFKPRGHSLCRAKSLGNTDSKDKKDFLHTARSKRSNSMPQQVLTLGVELAQSERAVMKPVCYRKRPILSSDEDEDMGTVLIRVMVFGADHVAGKLARAYNSLRKREKLSPRLTKHCRMKFFFIPVKRGPTANGGLGQISTSPFKSAQVRSDLEAVCLSEMVSVFVFASVCLSVCLFHLLSDHMGVASTYCTAFSQSEHTVLDCWCVCWW